ARRDRATEVQPARARPSAQGVGGLGEGFASEGCLDPRAHRVEINPNGRQRIPVEVAEQAGPAAKANPANDFLLDMFRRDSLLAQGGAGGLASRGHGEQEMLAADMAVAETAGVVLGV